MIGTVPVALSAAPVTDTLRWYALATPKSWATYYNLEVIIVLAFRLNTYEASRIRQKVLESIYQRKESVISLLICKVSIDTLHFFFS